MLNKPKKVLILGSGALKIGEAGEFDYSGSQALKALKEEGVDTVLINPNIATVQTTEKLAGKVYLLPLTVSFVQKVIEKEKPDGILLSFGGQTALNCGLELEQEGILDKFHVKVLGTPTSAIRLTEDRQLFADLLRSINVETPRSLSAKNNEEALRAAENLGYPIIVRAAFTLGGQGSGFCNNKDELNKLAKRAFTFSDQILIEESLKGWKEVEYEVVRDVYDNCITVCNMENFDPLGIHTGESIVVAPSQTLSNREYHKLREVSIGIIKKVGVVGECNVQFALNPNSEEYRVIEVNARLSRSSALASKATGYPLAFVAAKLALNYGLHELKNSITKTTSAFFEPSLDYVICKLPRWDLAKFVGVNRSLGSSMKSVGEVMAIGRSFEESIQKGLRMIGMGMHGFTSNRVELKQELAAELQNPTDLRIFYIAKALKEGYSIEKLHSLTGIDPWFLSGLHNIINIEKQLNKFNSLKELNAEMMHKAKQNGFSDFQIVRAVLNSSIEEIDDDLVAIRAYRKKMGILPFVKQIDTLAAEFPAHTNYLYLTYHGNSHDIEFEQDQKSVIVLGSGAYRIGSSVEFDWAGVNTIESLQNNNYRGVIINFNPETVSTDYDISDRLFFEELSLERVLDIYDLEQPKGIIVSVGGQIPNTLAARLAKYQIPILGTPAESIDRAEDRFKFSEMLDKLKIDQPRWKELSELDEIKSFVDEVGFPVLIRPSYVLSGAAMNVVSNATDLFHYLDVAADVSKQHPVVVSEFITNSKEIEFDGVAQAGEIKLYAISEHIEFAGVHSGDATLVFPPQKVYFETIRRIKKVARLIAQELMISGPFNIQFIARDNFIKVIECNLRASRSFPFVSKVLNENFIDLATQVMMGISVDKPEKSIFDIDHIGIKASQFSFSRLTQADPVLGVDMSSTGEVGCIGDHYYEAILKAMLSVGYKVPSKAVLVSSGDARSKVELLESCRLMVKQNLKLYATPGTQIYLETHGIEAEKVYWPDDNRKPNVMQILENQMVDLVVNIPKNLSTEELNNDFEIRRNAVDRNIPILTNARLASAFILSFCLVNIDDLAIKAMGDYDV
jgi:carbamoyl-phosphate synthase large subunit